VNHSLAILHEDPHCLAIVKPSGQFTQGFWAPLGEITLETAVRRYLDPTDPGAVYLGIVHRLDRPTSGVLIWAKTPKAARRLSLQFERRRVVKEYWAIVETGQQPAGPSAVPGDETWTDWLTRADLSGVVRAVESHAPGAREAVTRVRFEIARSLPERCAWLRLWPQTGRTHQLRAQAARLGMPILGDSAYGSTAISPLTIGIALHARALALNHPITGSEMTLVAPLPAAWALGGIVLHLSEASDATERPPDRPVS
jgi:23S rRNA pseudouridine1911/1915/1917 synthase